MALVITENGAALRFSVRVQPRAAENQVVGTHGSALKVRLQAPPVDGAANDALMRFLAEVLGVRRSHVRLVAGAASRTKLVEVVGADRERLIGLAGGVGG